MARCDSCGERREVGDRQARRIRMAGGGKCSACRGARVIEPRDSDYRYWLSMFGVEVPKGMSARESVVASGMPDELQALAKGFDRGFSG